MSGAMGRTSRPMNCTSAASPSDNHENPQKQGGPPRRDEEGLHFLYIKGYSNFVVDSYTNCHPPPWKPGLRQPIRLSLSGKLQCRFGARNHTVHGSRVGRSLPCSLFSALCFWGRGFCLRPPLAIIGKLSPHLFPKCQHILRG